VQFLTNSAGNKGKKRALLDVYFFYGIFQGLPYVRKFSRNVKNNFLMKNYGHMNAILFNNKKRTFRGLGEIDPYLKASNENFRGLASKMWI
jgi:hypothetical protein